MTPCPPEHSDKIAKHFRKGINYKPQVTGDETETQHQAQ